MEGEKAKSGEQKENNFRACVNLKLIVVRSASHASVYKAFAERTRTKLQLTRLSQITFEHNR